MMYKIYHLVNKETKIKMKCTEKFLLSWLALGFEVEEIELVDDDGETALSRLSSLT